MKKLFLAGISIVLLLAGCANNPKVTVTDDESFGTDVVQATVAPALTPTPTPEDSDFRNLKWGMTLDEVIAAEGTEYEKINDNLVYYSRVQEEDFPAEAEYAFIDNRLAGATFYIQPEYEDLNQYVEDYALLSRKFSQRYGESTSSKRSWYEENLDKETAKYGQAVLDGKLIWRTEWNVEDTQIKLVLSRRDGAVCIGIRYVPIA